jgi:hypothetical protein
VDLASVWEKPHVKADLLTVFKKEIFFAAGQ